VTQAILDDQKKKEESILAERNAKANERKKLMMQVYVLI